MIPKEKEDIEKLKKDFSRLKKKTEFTKNDKDKLITDITGLIGIYAINKRKDLAKLIEEILSFAEKKNWGVEGSRMAFDKIKKGKFKVKLKNKSS